MSRPAKLTLAASVLVSGLTVWGVHYMQEREREVMYRGVERDEARQEEKRRKRQLDLEINQQKEKEYQKLQPTAVSMEQLGVGPHRKPRTFASLYDVVARIMCTPTTDEAQEVDPTRPRYVSFDELLNTTHTIESPQSTDDHDVEQTEQTERQTRCKRPRGGWMDGLRALRTYEHECVCSGQYCFCYVLKPNFTKHVKPVPRPLKLCPRFARTPLPDWPTASVEESSAASSSSSGRLKLSHLQPFLRDLALLYDDDEDEDEDEDEDK
ncbi:cytochrome c oxidase assembly protein [Moesziomyces antarcticus]|uniref:Uncharacterized protein n=1 Tax=Pseudozyma antarctica TaxID=84753 RepID=A0A5C3FIV2_PSEA2|nr:cytochrome c oxidase assembly protein [Moesziomyces antarcticus]GAK62830.1 cytochrome c oxidase assembly protein [Moesziomyces antarcticus]SPO43695.1 uncharacterized protein PSANT_01380 [Moesziomyces antarcticus]